MAALKRQRHEDLPRVGVLAQNTHVATSLARELGIRKPIVLSPACVDRIRGISLDTLIVESKSWPLSPAVATTVMPALKSTKGYILHVQRVDPQEAL